MTDNSQKADDASPDGAVEDIVMTLAKVITSSAAASYYAANCDSPFYKRIAAPQVGDLVCEISNVGADAINRVGRLKSCKMENPPPESVDPDNYDDDSWGRPYPPYQEKIWRIETLDGREFRWWNATFIAIPEEHLQWQRS